MGRETLARRALNPAHPLDLRNRPSKRGLSLGAPRPHPEEPCRSGGVIGIGCRAASVPQSLALPAVRVHLPSEYPSRSPLIAWKTPHVQRPPECAGVPVNRWDNVALTCPYVLLTETMSRPGDAVGVGGERVPATTEAGSLPPDHHPIGPRDQAMPDAHRHQAAIELDEVTGHVAPGQFGDELFSGHAGAHQPTTGPAISAVRIRSRRSWMSVESTITGQVAGQAAKAQNRRLATP